LSKHLAFLSLLPISLCTVFHGLKVKGSMKTCNRSGELPMVIIRTGRAFFQVKSHCPNFAFSA